jgi:hypothetical protein
LQSLAILKLNSKFRICIFSIHHQGWNMEHVETYVKMHQEQIKSQQDFSLWNQICPEWNTVHKISAGPKWCFRFGMTLRIWSCKIRSFFKEQVLLVLYHYTHFNHWTGRPT